MTTNSGHSDKHAEHSGKSGCCDSNTQTAAPEKTQRPEPTEAKPAKPASDRHGCCKSDH